MHLREGFTTGSAATAAAMAAALMLTTKKAPQSVRIPLPPFDALMQPRDWMTIALAQVSLGIHPSIQTSYKGLKAQACVIKDGGDDPDATNHALIHASVILHPEKTRSHISFTQAQKEIIVLGGLGVGIVTLPGLPIPPGKHAINPVPLQQIRYGLWHILYKQFVPVTVIITVPQGKELALNTFNPRLGILGGISILGTQGTVKPYSHEAFAATIAEQISIARAMGVSTLYFATGRRSEKALQSLFPDESPHAFIEVGDLVGAAMQMVSQQSWKRISLGLYFGKLIKLAQGNFSTHAHIQSIDFEKLAHLAQKTGIAKSALLSSAKNAQEVLCILQNDPCASIFIHTLVQMAASFLKTFSKYTPEIYLFDRDTNKLLCKSNP